MFLREEQSVFTNVNRSNKSRLGIILRIFDPFNCAENPALNITHISQQIQRFKNVSVNDCKY